MKRPREDSISAIRCDRLSWRADTVCIPVNLHVMVNCPLSEMKFDSILIYSRDNTLWSIMLSISHHLLLERLP